MSSIDMPMAALAWLASSGGLLAIGGAMFKHVLSVERRLTRIEAKLGIIGN